MNKTPIVFISYSWDGDIHQNWVLNLANRLIADGGIDVKLDQYELRAGKNLNQFMESSVAEADKVLLILTENYKTKAENRKGGIGYEYSMITTEWFKDQTNKVKFIPVLRGKERAKCVPSFVSAFISHDMNNDVTFEADLKKLIYEIYDKSPIKKPKIGNRPAFLDEDTEPRAETSSTNSITEQIQQKRAEYQAQKEESITNELKKLIAQNKLGKAIEQMLKHTEKLNDSDLYNNIISLSARWNGLHRDVNSGILTSEQKSIRTARITQSLLAYINELD